MKVRRIVVTLPVLLLLGVTVTTAWAQITFPYYGSDSTSNPLFWLSQTGLGNAGRFEISTAGNSKGALVGITKGTGNGVYGLTYLGVEGVHGESRKTNGAGVVGIATSGPEAYGVKGQSQVGWGVYGQQAASGNYASLGGTDDAVQAVADSLGGNGVRATANNGPDACGVFSESTDGVAVFARSTNGTGVLGSSVYGCAVSGTSTYGNAGRFEIDAVSNTKGALVGITQGTGYGVYGLTYRGNEGVHGESRKTEGIGVKGIAYLNGYGVYGESGGWGVYGRKTGTDYFGALGGVQYGVYGNGEQYGVYGNSFAGVAVAGSTSAGTGVYGSSVTGYAVHGFSYGTAYAGYFDGKAKVTGYLEKAGGGFQIDHPLDPENKYLNHSFVESPDMKNVYDGVAVLDSAGEAWVQLPDWFEALNRDFRYQLTAIGAPGPNLYIAEEVSGNAFKIAGGQPGMKVSWQVTGIRQDAWANANRKEVEEDKPDNERGYYQNPEAFGQPKEMGIAYVESLSKPK